MTIKYLPLMHSRGFQSAEICSPGRLQEVCHGAAIGLRNDYGSGGLQAAAKRSKDGPQARRLVALAAIYDGATRTEAAKIGGVGLQVVRDWVVKFNAQGPDGLIDRKAPGQPPRLNDVHRAALAAIIESSPIPAIHGVVRWRSSISANRFSRNSASSSPADVEPRAAQMDYRKLSARPRHHAQAESALRTLKKSSRAPGRDQPREGIAPDAIEVWFADERASARRTRLPAVGPSRTRPSAPKISEPPPLIYSRICPKTQGAPSSCLV